MTTIKEKVAPSWETIDGSRFLLAPLSPFDAIDFRNEMTFKKGKVIVSGEAIRIGTKGIRDWQDVLDKSGNQIQFSASTIEDLDRNVLQQIATKVFERTFMSEIERKNLSSPSTSG